jgi:hypothetical protein
MVYYVLGDMLEITNKIKILCTLINIPIRCVFRVNFTLGCMVSFIFQIKLRSKDLLPTY